MKTGNKIALFYTAITIGIISMVTVVFYFVATDYIHGENYEYSYLLENYNTSWTELQKDNEVVFTKLPYGNYVLKVRYKNDVFDSDAKEYFLHIRVLPPWYRGLGL